MKADSVWGSGKSCLVYRGAQRHGPTGDKCCPRELLESEPCVFTHFGESESTVTIDAIEEHLRVQSKPSVFTRSVLLGMQGQPIKSIGHTPS